jgi:S-adenosylmethionine:tRNA ribosyltransferase-isomerase
MRRDELLYELPPDRIAQYPVEPRDASRLLVLPRDHRPFEHARFRDLERYVRPGDCLVLNDSRVIPARFHARRRSGGRVEGLFLAQRDDGWQVLLRPASRLRVGERIRCEQADVSLILVERLERGVWRVHSTPPTDPPALLSRIGTTPLPPYVDRSRGPDPADAERYQTVYARVPGSAAAPTAGLHFTPELLARLRSAGVLTASVTLHVGPGTFAPIDAPRLEDHALHAEWFEAGEQSARRLQAVREKGGRLVAVGTTAARVLESLPDGLGAASGWTRLFIYPPYRFRHVDALLTNFHLPGSTLLALVMAFGGAERVGAAYREAIEAGYRFYSYGDAMLIVA